MKSPFVSMASASIILWGSAVLRGQDSLTDGLIAFYPFNGNARDESGNGNDARVYNALPGIDRFGTPDACYLFNGNSAYIKGFADRFPRRARTISLWFKPAVNAPSAPTPILFAYGGGACGTSFIMGRALDQLVVGYHCVTGPTVSLVSDSGAWQQWVVVVSPNGVQEFVNGVEVYSSNGAISPTSTSGTEFSIGVAVSPAGGSPYTDINIGYFKGWIDDVRIYDRAMNPADVRRLFALETHRHGTLSISVRSVHIDMFVTPGNRYLLESSLDLIHWVPIGDSFVANSSVASRDVDVDGVARSYRFSQVP